MRLQVVDGVPQVPQQLADERLTLLQLGGAGGGGARGGQGESDERLMLLPLGGAGGCMGGD